MLWVLSVVQPDLLCVPEGPCGRGEASVEAGARERWWWQCQRRSLERDRERATSGQIPAAEEHVKCEKLRQTVDLGRAVGSQTKGLVLHVMCQKSHKQARQGLGGQVGRRPQLRAVRVLAGQESWELWERGAH